MKGEILVAPPTIIPNDNVQHSVKCKLDFDESKLNIKQKNLLDIKVVNSFYVTFGMQIIYICGNPLYQITHII